MKDPHPWLPEQARLNYSKLRDQQQESFYLIIFLLQLTYTLLVTSHKFNLIRINGLFK